MASTRVIARPRAHSSSNVFSPTRERRSSRFGAGSGQPTSNVSPRTRSRARHLEGTRESRLVARFTLDRERLGQQRARRLGVAGFEREEGEAGEGVRDAPRVVETSVDGQALFEQVPCAGPIAPDEREAPEGLLPGADAPEISVRAREADGLLERPLGRIELPDGREGDPDVPQSMTLHVWVVPLPRHLESFPAQGDGRIRILACDSEQPERARDHAHVAEAAVHRKALPEHAPGRLEVAEHERQRPDHRLGLGAGARCAGAECEQLLQSLPGFLFVVPQLPVAPEGRADPEARLRVACLHRPGERSADVVPLGVEALEPLALLRAE